ncbi:MAG: hypothetical protein ACKOQ3_11080 [Novosphingobium sp.]
MAALLFTLLAVLVTGLAARDQALLAAMVARQGPRPALLLVAAVSGIASVAAAVWLAQVVAAAMPAPARQLFVAIALGIAGFEMLVLTRRPAPAEPTHSLGAFALVLLAGQITDAARFVAMGMAVATRALLPVALGAGAAVLALALMAWLAADLVRHPGLARARRMLGGAVLIGAVLFALRALSLI